ncbi:ADP-ribosylation factor-like protein 6-interacting protein 4 [Cimex lectularius]|uniref:ADP-ribosylation factor-like protein 6-interacting protein 4 n=1 Tax=Cimex lectularius TaxID=79782 RepID=A0A8I6S1M3_CIMLE|nr:ADP-ribosylation factor-like protein 6-interacting protein 4 [Cimex lectularius]
MGSTKRSRTEDEERKRKKKKKHEKKKKSKKKRSRSSSSDRQERKKKKDKKKNRDEPVGPLPPAELALEVKKSFAPMTKEDWEKKQSVVRKVYDEQSGRYRLVKGDGEIIEEIVSKDRHKEINKQATQGDGEYFQSVISKGANK